MERHSSCGAAKSGSKDEKSKQNATNDKTKVITRFDRFKALNDMPDQAKVEG